MAKRDEWLLLAERFKAATQSKTELDEALAFTLGWKSLSLGRHVFWKDPSGEVAPCLPRWSGCLDAIIYLIEDDFPGWIVRVQWCGASAEAWVAPDLNNPKCPKIYRADPARWHDYCERNEVEIRPGSCRAAILALGAAFCRAKADTV